MKTMEAERYCESCDSVYPIEHFKEWKYKYIDGERIKTIYYRTICRGCKSDNNIKYKKTHKDKSEQQEKKIDHTELQYPYKFYKQPRCMYGALLPVGIPSSKCKIEIVKWRSTCEK